MKLSKIDLKQKISDLIEDNSISIQLLEDIEDSFVEEDNSKYEDLELKYQDLEKKYKERFLEGTEVKKIEKTEEEPIEKNIIDIKEI